MMSDFQETVEGELNNFEWSPCQLERGVRGECVFRVDD